MLLSIGMMIKNEEKHLRECLQSLMPLLDCIESELIIVDTGSTDDSVNIAKNFTEKVYFHTWNDNFSEMRNKVIDYCTGEWIMIIDGDEVLENHDEIIKFIQSSNEKKFNTVLLMVKNLANASDLSNYSMLYSPRMFRNDKGFRYEGAVHNQPIYKVPVAKIESSIIHYGYISTDKELMEKKYKRTVNLLNKELEKDPLNFYYWYQLSVSYAMHDEKENSLKAALKSYETLKNSGMNVAEYIYVYMQLACSYLFNDQYTNVIEACKEGISLKSEILDFYFYLAKAKMMIREYNDAIKTYKEYLNVLKNINKISSTNITLYTLGKYEFAYYDLVVAFKEIGENENAFVYCKKITDDELIKLNLPNVICLCIKMKYYDYLLQYFDKYIIGLNLQSNFEALVEGYQKGLPEDEKSELANTLRVIEGSFGILNKVRYSISKSEKLDFELSSYIESSVDFKYLPDFYGDLLYYLILHNISICNSLQNVRELEFNRFFVYLSERYKDFGEKIVLYLYNIKFNEEKSSLRIKKALERYALLTTEINDEDYINIFNQFLKDGTAYICEIYSRDIILNEDIYELKNEEEGFLLYLYKATSVKNSDKKLYISYLRKAMNIYPYLSRGIEYLLNEFSAETNLINKELEEYKIQVKYNIKSLIESGKLEQAKELLGQYKNIVSDDIDLYSMDAILHILEGELEAAEIILKEGLSIDNYNIELLYNLAYLFEIQNNNLEANAIYNVLEILNKEVDLGEVLESRNDSLKTKYNVILFGEYNKCLEFKENMEQWNVIGICSDDGTEHFIKYSELIKYNYDFIFVLECFNKDEVNEKLKDCNRKDIYYMEDFRTSVIEGLDYRFLEVFRERKIEGIITGLSYAEVGILGKLLPYNFINFAFSAQDLYYDFYLLKYLLNFEEIKNSLRYSIINLAYYSFDYDITKTVSKYRIHRYSRYFKDYHNNSDIIGVDITKTFYDKRINIQDYIDMNKMKENCVLNLNDDNGIYEAKRNSSMDYKTTRCEYEEILNNYLDLLEQYGIKPIIVICPTSSHYRKYFDFNKKTIFYNSLKKIIRRNNIQIIDYFDNNIFNDDDFWDYSHLNRKGAEKFTKLLNEEIIW